MHRLVSTAGGLGGCPERRRRINPSRRITLDRSPVSKLRSQKTHIIPHPIPILRVNPLSSASDHFNGPPQQVTTYNWFPNRSYLPGTSAAQHAYSQKTPLPISLGLTRSRRSSRAKTVPDCAAGYYAGQRPSLNYKGLSPNQINPTSENSGKPPQYSPQPVNSRTATRQATKKKA